MGILKKGEMVIIKESVHNKKRYGAAASRSAFHHLKIHHLQAIVTGYWNHQCPDLRNSRLRNQSLLICHLICFIFFMAGKLTRMHKDFEFGIQVMQNKRRKFQPIEFYIYFQQSYKLNGFHKLLFFGKVNLVPFSF